MPLFEREKDELHSDAGSQALSVIAIDHAFVEGVYDKLASVYDLTFGPILHPFGPFTQPFRPTNTDFDRAAPAAPAGRSTRSGSGVSRTP